MSDWTFCDIADDFDDHVVASVLSYKEFHSTILEMGKYFIQPNTYVVDIGCSTGVLTSELSRIGRNATYYGIDIVDNMIVHASKKYAGVNFLCMDAKDFTIKNTSYVVCMLSLQFMGSQDRIEVLANAYSGLNDGGALIVVEKVSNSNPVFNDMYNDLY